MKFSIIMPIYNIEKYLRKSLDSIVEQTFKDYEVIMVNDGSTDNSELILNEYVSRNGFKIINRKNGGCYAARVEGIINSSGEYIINLDPDDCFSSNTALEKLNAYLNEFDNPDILIYGYNVMTDSGEIIKTNFREKESFIEDDCKIFYKRFLSSTKYNSIWSKVFKKKLFLTEQVINRKINMCDDVFISLNIMKKATSIICVDEIFYNYRINLNGLVKQYKKSDLVNVLVYEKMIEFVKDKKLGSEFMEIAANRLLKDCAVTYLLAPNNIKGKEECFKSDLCEIATNSTYQKICNDYVDKQSFCIRFINNLIKKKKLRTILLLKRIVQNKRINNLLRKIYGKT